MRVLVTGWFSFEGMGASAGDLISRDLVCDWLRDAGIPFDVAVAAPFTGGVDRRAVDERLYTHGVFVCGPFGNGGGIRELLDKFSSCRWFGLNLSMLQTLEEFDPFEVLWERDSERCSRPDLTFFSERPSVPVAGVILVHRQKEYGARAMHDEANAAIRAILDQREMAAVEIDTRLDQNRTNLRTAAEVESLIARMDVVLSTRLHGLALGLGNGVPVLAIDPVAGGAKVQRQAKAIGWPVCFTADALDDARLLESLDFCTSESGRREARACRDRARRVLHDMPRSFIEAVTGRTTIETIP